MSRRERGRTGKESGGRGREVSQFSSQADTLRMLRGGSGNGSSKRYSPYVALILLANLGFLIWLAPQRCSYLTAVYLENPHRKPVRHDFPGKSHEFSIKINDVSKKQDNVEKTHSQWIKKKEAEMKRRRQQVKQICGKEGDKLQWDRPMLSKFWLVDKAHGLAYCRIPKAGTTSILHYFLELSGLPRYIKSKKKGNLRFLHDKVAPKFMLKNVSDSIEIEEINALIQQNDIHPFVFVRHPFERIVSAYEDKILVNKVPEYKALIRKIGITFPAFVDHVIDSVDQAANTSCNLMKGSCSIVDEHFTPFYSWCAFCDIPFETIGKVESFQDDFKYLIEKTGMQDVLKIDAGKMHSTKHARDRAKKYFMELSRHQKRRLVEIYALDFDMFGYSAKEYLMI